MKIRHVVDELFHVDGQTDMKLRVAFRSFVKAPKMETYYLQREKKFNAKFYGIDKSGSMNRLRGDILIF
jgi:hypothetical protein